MVHKGFYKLMDYSTDKGMATVENTSKSRKIVCASKISFLPA